MRESFAMTGSRAQQTSPHDSWDLYERRIVLAVRTMYPHLSAENYDAVLESIRSKLPARYLGDTAAIRDLVSRVADPFIAEKRRLLWEAHKAFILPTIRDMIPAAAREFTIYYTTTLLKHVFDRFNPETWSSEEKITEKLEKLVGEVVPMATTKLITDKGELCDEELVRLYRAGFPNCKTRLLERYNTKLRQLAPSIVYAKAICPESADPVEFIKDVVQETSVKLLTGLDTYKFESSFETWVGSICENEAYAQQRKLLGRSKQGKRRYVSFEELRQEPEASIPNEDHREILHKIIDKHRQQGPRAAKSTTAIEWRHFEGMDSKAIAERLHTTLAYVYQLFSHDYPELRRIGMEDFGISGTDL